MQTVTTPNVEFFFDLHSPYAYLAATQMDGIEERTAVSITWRPFLLGGVFKAAENRMPAAVPAKARYLIEDLRRCAHELGVPMTFPSWFPGSSLLPMRVATAAFSQGQPAGRAFCLHAFRAAWGENVDLQVPEALMEIAAMAGLNGTQLLSLASSAAIKGTLRDNSDDAVKRGAFGAPAIFVDDDLYWGHDRLYQVERRLSGGDA